MSNKVAIIAANGGLFDAYKVFNIATAAAASDKEVAIFFTFEGLNLIHKQGMHGLEMPAGKEHFAEGFEKCKCTKYSRISRNGTRFRCKIYCLSNDNGCDGLNKRRLC